MSMEASGKFAGALVFASRLGKNVVRQLVTPSNPKSLGQENARNIIRVTGAAQHFTKLTTLKGAGRSITDKAALIANTPTGQTWNSYLVKSMTGVGAVNNTAAQAIWTSLTSPEKAAWDAAAAALTPAILSVAQKGAGGVAATASTAGQVFLHYQYGLFVASIAAIPTATPPTYA